MNRLREYREHYGWSQQEVIAEIRRCALERGDPVAPGLDQLALSRHELGVKRPGPPNRELYCLVYGASLTPTDTTTRGDGGLKPRTGPSSLIQPIHLAPAR